MTKPVVRTTDKDGEKYVNILDLVRVYTSDESRRYSTIDREFFINQLLGLLK